MKLLEISLVTVVESDHCWSIPCVGAVKLPHASMLDSRNLHQSGLFKHTVSVFETPKTTVSPTEQFDAFHMEEMTFMPGLLKDFETETI